MHFRLFLHIQIVSVLPVCIITISSHNRTWEEGWGQRWWLLQWQLPGPLRQLHWHPNGSQVLPQRLSASCPALSSGHISSSPPQVAGGGPGLVVAPRHQASLPSRPVRGLHPALPLILLSKMSALPVARSVHSTALRRAGGSTRPLLRGFVFGKRHWEEKPCLRGRTARSPP